MLDAVKYNLSPPSRPGYAPPYGALGAGGGGNYLLDKFNIEFKYPKLSRVLKLRLKVQSYYFTYITVLGILTLLVNIILNTKAFLGL